MKMPFYIHSIRRIYSPSCMAQVEGSKYAFAVCEPYTAGRLKAAWWVLTGKAYAFEWPKAGDLEAAIDKPLWDRSKTLPHAGTQAGAQERETAAIPNLIRKEMDRIKNLFIHHDGDHEDLISYAREITQLRPMNRKRT